jgi:hypothetical protein
LWLKSTASCRRRIDGDRTIGVQVRAGGPQQLRRRPSTSFGCLALSAGFCMTNSTLQHVDCSSTRAVIVGLVHLGRRKAFTKFAARLWLTMHSVRLG